jgi:tight adherence protein B
VRELLIILVSLFAIAALEGTRQLVRWSRQRRREELKRRLRSVVSDAGAPFGPILLRKGKLAATPALDTVLRKFPLALRAEKLLEQADSGMTVAQLIALTALAACAGFSVALVLQLGLAIALLLALTATGAPTLMLLVARTNRSHKISEQLPEALDMMARSLRAGHALTSAFQVVAGEMPEPVSIEFARAYEEQRLGVSLERAVTQMAARAPGNADLKIFAVSAVIQRETGGNLAEILEKIAQTIRLRYQFYGKLRALTAEGRASAAVLGVLPFVVALALSFMRPGYLTALTETPMGRGMLAYAVASWAVGLVMLNRMTKLEV